VSTNAQTRNERRETRNFRGRSASFSKTRDLLEGQKSVKEDHTLMNGLRESRATLRISDAMQELLSKPVLGFYQAPQRQREPFRAVRILMCLPVLALLLLPSFPILAPAATASGNYAGYQVTGAPQTLNRARGSWVVPGVDCSTTPNSVLNMSVMIDGINGVGDAMEIGTFSNCVSGSATFGAFVNFYPTTTGRFDKILSIKIKPGDVVEAQGEWLVESGSGRACPTNSWHSSFIDENTTRKVDTNACTPSGFVAPTSSAAFLLTSGGSTLSSFSSIPSGRDLTKVRDSDVAGLIGTQGTCIGLLSGLSTLTMSGAYGGPISPDGCSFTLYSES